MKSPLVKICGITSIIDLKMILKYSPDYIGFIFHKPSKRNISLTKIKEFSKIFETPNNHPKRIGVFVNPTLETLTSLSDSLDGFQLHGEETPAFCEKIQSLFPDHEIWKAFRISSQKDLEKIKMYPHIETVVVDAFCENEYGGTGKVIDKNLLPLLSQYIKESQKLIIAGGVNAQNAQDILTLSNADGIDLSSRMEISAGKKSEEKIKELFNSLHI